LTKNERFQLLSQKTETLCILASSSLDRFESLTAQLDEMITKMLNPRPRQRTNVGGEQREVSRVPMPEAEAEPTIPAAQPSQGSTGDENSLREALGLNFSPCPTPPELDFLDNEWWRSLMGRYIALKFSNKRQGGWHLGQIVGVGVDENTTLLNEESDSSSDDELTLPEGSVLIAFPNDTSTAQVALMHRNYSEVAYATKNAWMFVQEKPLGREDVSALQDPLGKPKKVGRRRTTRFAPAAGIPTSKRPRGKR
jgi:hypothetical protein